MRFSLCRSAVQLHVLHACNVRMATAPCPMGATPLHRANLRADCSTVACCVAEPSNKASVRLRWMLYVCSNDMHCAGLH